VDEIVAVMRHVDQAAHANRLIDALGWSGV
jgi:hypothetical protein